MERADFTGFRGDFVGVGGGVRLGEMKFDEVLMDFVGKGVASHIMLWFGALWLAFVWL